MGDKRLTGRAALLYWCQQATEGYPGVQVDNFTKSWRDGLAFCALLHRYYPEMIDFAALNKADMRRNLELAFDVAEKAGISRLLDVEDVADFDVPDSFSIITYLAQFYQKLGKESVKGHPSQIGTAAMVALPVRVENVVPPAASAPAAASTAKAMDVDRPAKAMDVDRPAKALEVDRPLAKTPAKAADVDRIAAKPVDADRPTPIAVTTITTAHRPEPIPPIQRQVSSPVVEVPMDSDFDNPEFHEFKATAAFKPVTAPAPAREPVQPVVPRPPLVFPGSPESADAAASARNKRPATSSTNVIDACQICNKRVYIMERVQAAGMIFHKQCFKCKHCRTPLTMATFENIDTDVYCKPHFTLIQQIGKDKYEEMAKARPAPTTPISPAQAIAPHASRSSETLGSEHAKASMSDDRMDFAALKRPEPTVVAAPAGPSAQPQPSPSTQAAAQPIAQPQPTSQAPAAEVKPAPTSSSIQTSPAQQTQSQPPHPLSTPTTPSEDQNMSRRRSARPERSTVSPAEPKTESDTPRSSRRRSVKEDAAAAAAAAAAADESESTASSRRRRANKDDTQPATPKEATSAAGSHTTASTAGPPTTTQLVAARPRIDTEPQVDLDPQEETDKRELRTIEQEQARMQARGNVLEQQIRQRLDANDHDESVEMLLEEWFELLRMRNLMVYREEEIRLRLQERQLEQMSKSVDTSIRKMLLKSDAAKSTLEMQEQEWLVEEWLSLVRKRDEVIQLEEDLRIRMETTDKQRHRVSKSMPASPAAVAPPTPSSLSSCSIM